MPADLLSAAALVRIQIETLILIKPSQSAVVELKFNKKINHRTSFSNIKIGNSTHGAPEKHLLDFPR